MTSLELYRASTIGEALKETLYEMVYCGVLSPHLAIQVLLSFDQSIAEVFKSQVRQKVTIEGHLNTYSFCDDVWTFILRDAKITTDEGLQSVDRLKIVAGKSEPRSSRANITTDEGLQSVDRLQIIASKSEPRSLRANITTDEGLQSVDRLKIAARESEPRALCHCSCFICLYTSRGGYSFAQSHEEKKVGQSHLGKRT